MADTSLFYFQPKLAKTNPRELTLVLNITAAKTVAQRPVGGPLLTAFDAIAAQATINDFLGTTDEFLISQFDATALGADALGVIINMEGQASSVVAVGTQIYSTATLDTLDANISLGTGLTASSHTTQSAVGANGNIALRTVVTGLDALTSGVIVLKVLWISK